MEKTKVLFMGRKEVARSCLEWLLSIDSVEVVGVLTDSHLNGSVTAKYAKKKGLQLFTFEEALGLIQTGALKFDLGLSMLYWRKLKDEFLTIPSLGIINFHPAPLPEYKGTAGYNLAVLNGLNRWAVSAHYVDKNIDTGDLITVDYFKIDRDSETAQSVEAKTVPCLGNVFKNVTRMALSQTSKLPTTPNIGGTYISRAEMESMKEVQPHDDVDRKIRAFWFPPYDGAYILKNGKKYTLINREILESLAPQGASSLFSPLTKEK